MKSCRTEANGQGALFWRWDRHGETRYTTRGVEVETLTFCAVARNLATTTVDAVAYLILRSIDMNETKRTCCQNIEKTL